MHEHNNGFNFLNPTLSLGHVLDLNGGKADGKITTWPANGEPNQSWHLPAGEMVGPRDQTNQGTTT